QSLVPFTELTAVYTPRSLTRGTLVPVGDPHLVIEDAQPGDVSLLSESDLTVYDPQTFLYTTPEGRVLTIDKTAGVQSLRDLNGNTLTFGLNGISHSSGKGIAFTRDAQGRITQLTDPNGNSQTYVYDGNGDLASHTDPAGNVTHFLYNYSHGLIEIQDPR